MPSFSSLPTETVLAIAQHLADDKAALQSLCLVNKALADAITPLLWRTPSMRFPKLSCRKSLDRFDVLCSRTHNSELSPLKHVRSLDVSTQCLKYEQEGAAERAAEIDNMLSHILLGASALQDLKIDLCMSLYDLSKTMQAILSCSCSLHLLNIRNVYAFELSLTTTMPDLRHLSIGYSGKQLSLDLTCFPNLRSLSLNLEVHDGDSEREDDYVEAQPLRLPSSLWKSLRTLKLDIFPWAGIGLVIRDFEESLQGARVPLPLEDLAIFWNIPEPAQMHLLRLFARSCVNIQRVALTTWETPTVSYIHRLSSVFSSHKITQLTLCAYMPCGSWQWPDTASSYGTAFASFPYLRELAMNHNEDIENYELDDSSSGKFTYDCTEKSAELRLAFAEELARRCSSLSEIAFCPLEQQKSRVNIAQTRMEGGSLDKVSFVEKSCSIFWQYL